MVEESLVVSGMSGSPIVMADRAIGLMSTDMLSPSPQRLPAGSVSSPLMCRRRSPFCRFFRDKCTCQCR